MGLGKSWDQRWKLTGFAVSVSRLWFSLGTCLVLSLCGLASPAPLGLVVEHGRTAAPKFPRHGPSPSERAACCPSALNSDSQETDQNWSHLSGAMVVPPARNHAVPVWPQEQSLLSAYYSSSKYLNVEMLF